MVCLPPPLTDCGQLPSHFCWGDLSVGSSLADPKHYHGPACLSGSTQEQPRVRGSRVLTAALLPSPLWLLS